MPDHKEIYQKEAAKYQRLIDREDYRDNLRRVISEIVDWKDLDIVDLGTGTGRLAVLMAAHAGSLIALDLYPHMLGVAAARLMKVDGAKWLAAGADHRAIPLPARSADLVVSGWSFCYLAVWDEQNWEKSLEKGLREIDRVLRPGGTALIIETLGTGVEKPERPDKLEDYFCSLEQRGFLHRWLRTDYRFADWTEAEELVQFFFGQEMLPAIQPDAAPLLPECTGIWWKRQED